MIVHVAHTEGVVLNTADAWKPCVHGGTHMGCAKSVHGYYRKPKAAWQLSLQHPTDAIRRAWHGSICAVLQMGAEHNVVVRSFASAASCADLSNSVQPQLGLTP